MFLMSHHTVITDVYAVNGSRVTCENGGRVECEYSCTDCCVFGNIVKVL